MKEEALCNNPNVDVIIEKDEPPIMKEQQDDVKMFEHEELKQ